MGKIKYKWKQDGWYDCCGGGWFTWFTLLDEDGGETPVRVDSEEEAVIATSILDHYNHDEESVRELVNRHGESITLEIDICRRVLSDLNVDVPSPLDSEAEFLYDEDIDLSDSWTCYD